MARGAALAAGLVLLLRVWGDVSGKPLFEDEAIAGQVAARPVREILGTVLWDRGGAPLHFLLAHTVFAFDESAATLRWLSVVCALATVVVAYDLGRRLSGRVAGAVAATVVAGSPLLGVYASFGRMYALFALAAALAGDAFVHALDERSASATALAAAAAWLLPAIHPYGGIVVLVEAFVAFALWRGRPLRAALPAAAVSLLLLPFVVSDARLARRFDGGGEARRRVASPHDAGDQLATAVQGFAGGRGVTLVFFLLLVAVGTAVVARSRPAYVAFAYGAVLAPPLLAVVVPRGGDAPDLSPRHLIYGLPLYAALAGAGVARLTERRGALVAVVALGVLAFASPAVTKDPRRLTYGARLGTPARLAAPAVLLRHTVKRGDLLFPYSSVYLAALPQAGRGVGLPRAEPRPLADALRRAHYPVRSLFVAVPTDGPPTLDISFGGGLKRKDFPGGWTILRSDGPFPSPAAAAEALASTLAVTRSLVGSDAPPDLAAWARYEARVTREALRELEQP